MIDHHAFPKNRDRLLHNQDTVIKEDFDIILI